MIISFSTLLCRTQTNLSIMIVNIVITCMVYLIIDIFISRIYWYLLNTKLAKNISSKYLQMIMLNQMPILQNETRWNWIKTNR